MGAANRAYGSPRLIDVTEDDRDAAVVEDDVVVKSQDAVVNL
jgi:hypothetical protein